MKKLLVSIVALTLLLSLSLALIGCSAVEFGVNFVVDGEVYDTISTSGKEIIRMPSNPTKEGYTFGGWYWDEGTWQQPFTANSLLDAPLSADMRVYARWVEIHEHISSDWITDTEATCTIVGARHKECTACGEVLETEAIPTNDKHTLSSWIADTEATCTIIGAKHIECTACGKTLETETIPTNDKHTSSGWITDTESTCTILGSQHKECTACGDTLETGTIPTNDKHTSSDWIIDTEATCTITGTKHKACTACGETLENGTIPTNDKHTSGEWITDTEATCTITGTKHKECTACGETLENGTIPTNDKHTSSDWITDTEATCTITGTKHKECTACGTTLENGTIPTNDKHSSSGWITDTEATCTVTGTQHKECTACGVTLESGTIPINDKHTSSGWITDTEATCSIVGSQHKACTACGITLESGTIPTNDKHTSSDWITDTEATCTTTGTKHIECTACGETLETVTIPTNDKHTSSDWITDVEATCSIVGSKHIECTACGVTLETGTIPTNDKHTSSGWITDVEATCSIVGSKHIECTACGDTLETSTIPTNDKHTSSGWITDTEATCSIVGSKHKECTACGDTLETGTIPTNDKHTSSDWIIDTEATCTITGTKHKACTACGITLESGTIPTNDKHTPVTDEGREATDTHDGLTEGSHCGACGVVLVQQNVIPAKLQGTDIKSVSLTVNGDIITGAVSNTTERFSFLNDIIVHSESEYIVARDIDCEFSIKSKTSTLEIGDNTFYILVTSGKQMKLYTVTIRRLPMYTVSFKTNGGTAVNSQIIEEGSLATAPTTTRTGYTLAGWDYDFAKPITADTTINAIWQANTDTKYTVEYYLKNLDGGYDKTTKELSGTTEETVTITPDAIAHFTFNAEASTTSGVIDSEGKLVLKLYYTRNSYKVTTSVNNTKGGSVTAGDTYAYDTEITLKATIKPGYTFLGYFVGDDKVCETLEYKFKVSGDIDIVAKFEANTDTKYTVEYYLENLDGGFDKTTKELSGTTDETVTITPDAIAHFTFNAEASTTSGVIDGEGKLVLKLYYTRNSYTVSVNNSTLGTVSGVGTYPYGTKVTISAPSYLGCVYNGLLSGGEVLTTGNSWSGEIEGDITISLSSLAEMENFIFNSTATTCEITGIKDKSVTNIVVPDYVTSIADGAFSGCSKLESITLPFVGGSIKTSSNTYQYPFGYIFGTSSYDGGVATQQYYYGSSTSSTTNTTYCIPPSLKSVTITGGNILRGAFYNCTSLTSIVIPDSITSIGNNAFYNCTSLTSVVIPDSVTSIGNSAFYNCTRLEGVYIENITAWCNISLANGSANPLYYAKNLYLNEKLVTELVIPDSVTRIGEYAFSGCTSLTSVVIPNSVTRIASGAFSGCSKLESIVLPFVGGSIKTSSDTYQYPFGYIFGTYSYSGGVAREQYYYGSSTSSTTSTTYYIPSSLKSVTITGGNILYGAFNNCTSLTSIVIPDSVTSIGRSAFSDCTSLESIEIPDSVTSIGEWAFYYCTSLESIEIPDSVTSIGEWAFYYCRSLTSIILGKNVTSIGDGAFYYCTSLESIEIPDSVTSIGEKAFYYCTSLESIEIPDSVTRIGEKAFYYCRSLTSVEIPDSVTSIGSSAFSGCTSLTNIEVSADNTAYQLIDGNLYTKDGKTLVQYATIKTDTSFTIPAGVTSIGSGAFSDCKSLTSITIPDSVTSIGDYAFNNCTSLTQINFNATAMADLSSSNYVFYNAGKDGDGIKVVIGKNVTKIPAYLFSPCYITSVEFEEDSICQSIGNNAFSGCTSLTSVVIPDSVKSIGDYAFYDCDNLTSVVTPDSVTSIGDYAFYDCDNLTSVVTPDSVKSIGNYAFYNCTSLKSVVIGDSVTSIGEDAFSYCDSLTSVVIGDSVTSIGEDAFRGCTSLTQINFNATAMADLSSSNYVFYNAGKNGNGIKVVVGKNVTKIPAYLFYPYYDDSSYSPKITSVEFEEDSICESIGNYAFAYCTSLTSVVIPDSVTSIGWYAFRGCTSLTSVVIGDSVTGIGTYAFYGCTSLKSVVIGDSVIGIGKSAFYGCTSLTSIKYRGTSAQWSAISKGSSWNSNTGSYIITYDYKGD